MDCQAYGSKGRRNDEWAGGMFYLPSRLLQRRRGPKLLFVTKIKGASLVYHGWR